MAKSSSKSATTAPAAIDTANVFDGDNIPQGQGKFARVGAVSVPVLKVNENQTVYFRALQPILEKPTQTKEKVKDPLTGKESEVVVDRIINIMSIQDLTTGNLNTLVAGAILAKELKEYKGGNEQYVGLCFEYTKRPPAEGKRAKRCEVFEINPEA